jgi:signal transduction histidine kinase/streptogramin lyase
LNILVHGKIGAYKTIDNFYPLINRFLLSRDGHRYVLSDEGLFRLEGHRFLRLPFFSSDGMDLGQNLDRITEWKDLFLIIPWNTDQKEKLILYDKKSGKVVDAYTRERVFSTALSVRGELWASTAEGIRMIDRVALAEGKLKLDPLPDSYHVPNLKNAFIFFDSAGRTWLYGNDRALIIPVDGHQQLLSPAQGLKTGSLADIFVDREGNTWMASDGNGAVKMTGTGLQVIDPFIPGRASTISAICRDGETTWLFNGMENAICRVTANGTRCFPFGSKRMSVSNIYIQGHALYFTESSSLFRVRNKDQASEYRHPERLVTDSVRASEIANGVIDRNGALIQSMKKNESAFYLSVLYGNRLCMRYRLSYAVDQMAIDPRGRLWAASRDNHLMVFSLNPRTPGKYLQLIGDYSGRIPGLAPRSITVDTAGNVWIGTRYKGLYFLRFDDLKFLSIRQFSTRDGLTDNFIYRLYADEHNNIWAGTQTGLDKISRANGQYIVENITKSRNIFRTIYTVLSIGNHTIWALASDGGIIQVSDSPAAVPSAPPGLLLTSMKVADREMADSVHVFSYRQNSFSFSVAAPSFIDERSTRYSYLLKGGDMNAWSEPTANASFNFINLAPGKYELSLKATFPAGRYPPQSLTYSFTVQPPYWQTWWFRMLSASLAIGLICYVVRVYYQRLLERRQVQFEKQKALENERTRIATDMHDDLGSGLSKIRFLSETVQRNISEKAHHPILQNIAGSCVELVDKFNEIVWAMNEKNNSLEDLVYYVRNYTAKYCAENNLGFKINIPDEIPAVQVGGELRRELFLTVKESLHNVVKHAEARNVWLDMELGAAILLTIHDDGQGFDTAAMKSAGNGLRSMRHRIERVKGKLRIESGEGTAVSIMVPLTAI